VEGELQQRIGANVRTIRLARELSQEEFADALGVHRTYVGAIERGERNLTLQTIERLAQILSVEPLRLLADDFAAGELATGTRARAAATGDGRSAPSVDEVQKRRRARPSPPADRD
jgi:transcriptional regulator with XRE-family HTH domain